MRPEPVTAQAAHRRLSFTGARSKAIWEPRLARLGMAALETELRLIAGGEVEAGLIWCPYETLPAFVARLRAEQLAWTAGQAVLRPIAIRDEGLPAPDPLTLMTYCFVVARSKADADRLAADSGASIETALAFGYPRCCAAARVRTLADGVSDPLAVLAAEPAWAGHPSSTGVMLAALGLGPVRHMPCGPDCEASREKSRAFLKSMTELDLESEAGWLEDMTEWRAKASVAGGVAEVETGAFRFAFLAGDPGPPAPPVTAGTSAPEGAPAGLSSIFVKPATPARSHATSGGRVEPANDEGFAAAGFESRFAHRSRWSCVVWEQSRLLRKSRTALHLGCGSGLLLELLVQSRPSLRVCGIEADAALAAVARERLGMDAAMILEADWMEEARHRGQGKDSFDIAFVDPEPLIDCSPEARSEIVDGLTGLARSIILLASDRALRRFDSLDAMAAALGLALEPGRDRRISSVLASVKPALATA
jgi:hypothetical protein